jgi:hypothetical protein
MIDSSARAAACCNGSWQVLACSAKVATMKVPFTLGTVGHFGLAVRDPRRSAKWFVRVLGLREEFEFEEGVAVGNDNVTIVLSKGTPSPKRLTTCLSNCRT